MPGFHSTAKGGKTNNRQAIPETRTHLNQALLVLLPLLSLETGLFPYGGGKRKKNKAIPETEEPLSTRKMHFPTFQSHVRKEVGERVSYRPTPEKSIISEYMLSIASALPSLHLGLPPVQGVSGLRYHKSFHPFVCLTWYVPRCLP